MRFWAVPVCRMQLTLQAVPFPAAAESRAHTPWHHRFWHLPARHPCWADLDVQPAGRLWSDLDRQLLETVTILRQVVRDECKVHFCLQQPCRPGRACAVRRPQNILCTCTAAMQQEDAGGRSGARGSLLQLMQGCRMDWKPVNSYNASLDPAPQCQGSCP